MIHAESPSYLSLNIIFNMQILFFHCDEKAFSWEHIAALDWWFHALVFLRLAPFVEGLKADTGGSLMPFFITSTSPFFMGETLTMRGTRASACSKITLMLTLESSLS